ncbi:MAG: V-type ATP synthase subunit D [Promethearchaeota archaeon]
MKPTKTNLISLQKRLDFAIKGATFLEYKQEQIIFQLKQNWNDYRKLRNKYLNLFRKVMYQLNQTYKESGKSEIYLISQMSKIQYKPRINILYKKKVGIMIPYLKYELTEGQLPAYSFENTSYSLDELIITFKKTFKLMINVAEKEDLILKLALNYKKISRRINGLKNVIIPGLRSDIKTIKNILEEMDRENFVRLKKTKDLIKKKK